MLTIAITVAVCAFIGLITGYDLEERVFGAFAGAFGGLFAGAFAALMIGTFIYTDTKYVEVGQVPLVSMADGAGIHGHFFLGSGSVDSSPTYTWYEKSGDNSYFRQDVDADVATIHYLTDKRAPYYIVSKEVDAEGGFFKKWGFNTNEGYGKVYDFYVPKGSIVQSYVLDNK